MNVLSKITLGAAAVISLLSTGAVYAADTPTKIKFSLDWTIQNSTSMYILTKQKGYFAQEGLDVTIDPGQGGGGFVQRLTSGTYDIAVGDMTSYIQYLGANPDSDAMRAVYVVSNDSPYAIISLKKSGLNKPSDLVGKRIASAGFAAAKAVWPAFARSAKIDPASITWMVVDPSVRGVMLTQGQAGAVAGFTTDVPVFENLGVPADQFNVMKYSDYGVHFYGNTIFASHDFITKKPAQLAAFLRAINRGLRDTVADPNAAIEAVMKENPILEKPTEQRALKMVLDLIVTPESRKNGLGSVDPARLASQVDDLTFAFNIASKPDARHMYTAEFLPPLADRLPK